MIQTATGQTFSRGQLLADYNRVRAFSEAICAPLQIEDYVVQTMPDVSPTKWHLAHVSWFFESFVLKQALPDYYSPDPLYAYLYNSYYNALGDRHCRPRRGTLSRPTVAETQRYRAHVDSHMRGLIETADPALLAEFAPLIVLGLNHEQQHQELMATDIKHVLGSNPLHPFCTWRSPDSESVDTTPGAAERGWIRVDSGVKYIGSDGLGFAFDNESPRHPVILQPFELASRPVTNGEWLEFMADDGYARAELWLSMGWDTVQTQRWDAPLYWERQGAGWQVYALTGTRPLDRAEPVCHVSYFEADAFARWKRVRLPTEQEWESCAASLPRAGHFADTMRFHPAAAPSSSENRLQQMFGDVWEWTASPYTGYPGYAPAPGAVGEYNGKFMCNQYVLRGGSCATHSTHIRSTYRNFFPPDARWQFTGLRLAR